MPKTDLVRRTDQMPLLCNGELAASATIVQVAQLAMSSPFSGDFQIVDEGRLIVGEHPDLGPRVIVTNSGLHGYGPSGIHTMGLYSKGDATHTGGDWFAGNEAENYIKYNQHDGTLGLYSPAGAGFIATRDGSLQAGNADGAHMLWNSASRALEIRSGTDIKISLDDNGDGFFDGTLYAAGGRIYGNMQVDAQLRAGDVDGPGVMLGKFSRTDASTGQLVESSEIMATDAENLPWFHVVAGGGTAQGGYFHLGAPGDYRGRMTFDGETLQVAGWVVDSNAFVAPNGYVRMDTGRGLVFIGALEEQVGEGLKSVTSTSDARNFMVTFWHESTDDVWPMHRILAYQTSGTPDEQVLSIQAQPLYGDRAKARLSSMSDKQANTNLRAVGGSDTAYQQVTELNLWAYRSEGTAFDYRRIDFSTDGVYLASTDIASFGGTINNGTFIFPDGTGFDPGLGTGIYVRAGGEWKMLAANAADLDVKTATFTQASAKIYLVNASSGAVTANLLDAATLQDGWCVTFKKIDSSANAVTIDGYGLQAIDGAATKTLTAQWQYITIACRSGNSSWYTVGAG